MTKLGLSVMTSWDLEQFQRSDIQGLLLDCPSFRLTSMQRKFSEITSCYYFFEIPRFIRTILLLGSIERIP